MHEWKTRVFPFSFRLHAETCYTHLFHELTRVEKTLAIQGRVYLSLLQYLEIMTSVGLMDVFKRHETTFFLLFVVFVVADKLDFGECAIGGFDDEDPTF